MASELDPDQEVIRCLDSVQELLVLQHSLSLHLREVPPLGQLPFLACSSSLFLAPLS